MSEFSLTKKQEEAYWLLGNESQHVALRGGSRSGKTFVFLYAIIMRALKAPRSRHAVLRFRFNHIVSSIGLDTLPKLMSLAFPEREYHINKTMWYATLENDSEIWLGGLDDKERTEKILGNEYATIFLNECSQIPWTGRNLALTRLAQKVEWGDGNLLRPKMYYDYNPPSKAHWSYLLFEDGKDPESREAVPNRNNYSVMQVNPSDNLENLPDGYMETLGGLSQRLQKRFLRGEYADATENALFSSEIFDKYRTMDLPDMQRIIIAVDPSGAGEEPGQSDDIGIVVAGLGIDGYAYALEDLTLNAPPAIWGNVIGTSFDRHRADLVVGESNYGGAMVEYVIRSARPGTPYRAVHASRGKVVRAEPISALVETGKIRMGGTFNKLEDELCAFSTTGYTGQGSPNRADAFVWAMTELFPMLTRKEKPEKKTRQRQHVGGGTGWMAA